jgi:hypothetical protein
LAKQTFFGPYNNHVSVQINNRVDSRTNLSL